MYKYGQHVDDGRLMERENRSLIEELKDFLERLGRTVESDKPSQLVARARTALIEEEIRFKVLESSKERPLKRAINIVADGLPLPDRDTYPQAYYLEQFLDRTVHADELAQAVMDSDRIQSEASEFIPQNLESEGAALPLNSFEFFFREWLPSDGRLLTVLAPAGYGKTVLTCALASRMADYYLDPPEDESPPFPYLIDFGEFRRLTSFESMILTSLESKGVHDYHSNAFAYLVARRRAVLMLDGFDELLEERPEEAQKNLRELVETLEGRGKVVITARSTFFRTSDDVADFLEYYLEPGQVDVVDLQAFDKSQRRALVSKRCSTQTEINRVNSFIESEALHEAMGSPLLLKETIDALLTSPEERLDRSKGRKDLFGALEKSVYERERRRKHHLFADEVQATFLEELAREMLQYNARGFDFEEVQVAAAEAAGNGDAPDPAELDRFAHHHFLHIQPGSNEVRFNHQVFREYFQARSVIEACRAGHDGWVFAMLGQRPLPEEVRLFIAELDKSAAFPSRLLQLLTVASKPTEKLANNVGALCAAYRAPELVESFLEVVPIEVSLGFDLEGVDLAGFDWSRRFLQGMKFLNCNLEGTNFQECMISEIILAGSQLSDADFRGAQIDSLTLEFGRRVFGTPDALETLANQGASCGIESPEVRNGIREQQRAELVEVVRGRLYRFYVPGQTSPTASKWDSSISERNLLGGVKPALLKFVKSEVIPAMLKEGVLARRRQHGLVIYDLADAAEDDARALIERQEVVGTVAEVVSRLAPRSPPRPPKSDQTAARRPSATTLVHRASFVEPTTHNGRDSVGSLGGVLVFPNSENYPPSVPEYDIGSEVALDVRRELVTPPISVGTWQRPMSRTRVPEAPIHEYGHPRAHERKVRTRAYSWQDWNVNPVP